MSETDNTKKTGRGFLIITAAKVWFMITSAVVQLGLPIFLGSAEKFGVFKVVTESISLINMVMITGTLQAVSKLVSEDPARARRVVNRAVKLQCVIGLPIAGAYALSSPWIAASFNDPQLTSLLRFSSLIIGFYAFYAIFVGYLNGVKEFVRQASLDMTFATLKMIGIVGLVLLGFGVWGAIAGFVGAAAIIFVVSAILAWFVMRRRGEATVEDVPDDAVDGTRLFGYLLSVMLFNFALNGLMRVDLFVLKSVAADVPATLQGASGIFSTVSNKFAGFYGAVLNIARIPYQGVIAVTFVIFPLISESTFQNELGRTRSYIRETLRYCSLLIAPLGIALAFNADSIIGALYSSDYQAASTALAILAVAVVFFALLYVATTIIVGSGHPMHAVAIMGGSLGLSAGLNYAFLRRLHDETTAKLADLGWSPASPETGAEPPAELTAHAVAAARNKLELTGPYLLEAAEYMQHAAVATAIATFCGLVASLVWLWKKYGAGAPLGTVARIGLAAGLIAAFDWLLPLPAAWVGHYGKTTFLLLVLGKLALMGIGVLILLWIAGEFDRDDIDRLRSVIGLD